MNAREHLQAEVNDFALSIRLDLDKVSVLIWENGCDFATRYYAPRSALLAASNSLYWTWFLTEWVKRDRLLEEEYRATNQTIYWGDYHFAHLPAHMVYGQKYKAQPWEEVTRQINQSLLTHN